MVEVCDLTILRVILVKKMFRVYWSGGHLSNWIPGLRLLLAVLFYPKQDVYVFYYSINNYFPSPGDYTAYCF
jgi:hypothetical protein